jgi:hypothetical protein
MTFTPIPTGTLNWDVPVNAQFTNDDGRLDGIDSTLSFVNSVLTLFSNDLAAVQGNNPGAKDQTLDSWTFDPIQANANVSISQGVLVLSRFLVQASTSMSNIMYNVGTAGTGLTAGQNWVAVYNSTGTRVALTADQTTNFGTTGTKTASTGTVSLNVGFYWLAFLANGTTPPQMRGAAGLNTFINAGAPIASTRFAFSGTAQTVTPASFTPASITQSGIAPWGAVV